MKKVIAMLTTLVMTVSLLCQMAVFASFSDVDDTNSYKQAITTLTKLSVIDGYEDGTFKPAGEITRAEFTKLIVFVLGYQNLTYTNYSFDDVDSSHWARNYIQTAYNLGIIAGFEDNTFRPDTPVTYEQALKMVVCTLGYEPHAQNLGAWPEGYIKQASKLSLNKNVLDVTYSSGAPRGVIAQVLYNALDIEMYENNGYEWTKTEKTLLNDYLKAKKLKGTLVGVEDITTEECSYNLGEEQLDILTQAGEEVLINYSSDMKKSDISKYLGHTITLYYSQPTANDEKMLIIIDDETTKNSQLTLTYDDINNFSGNTLKYYDESAKQKTLKLKEIDLTVKYNGKNIAASDTVTLTNPNTKEEENFTRQEALEQWLNPDTEYSIYGNIILTDNANDGTVDMVQIYNYETMVAYTAPSTADYRITDKLVSGNYIVLDPQSAEYTYTITKNGAEIPVTSIAANDTILYAKSLDGSMYSLLVSNKSVKGSISSMNMSANQMTIAGNTYDIGSKCASYIKEKDGKELKAGLSGTFYIDALGTVVFGTLDQTTVSPYAYIADAFLDFDEGGKAYMTVYAPGTSASSALSYAIKDRVKFNGSTTDADSAIEKLKTSSAFAGDESAFADKIYGAGKTPNITPYSQPARITIKNNEITEIVVLKSDEIQSQNDDKEQIVKCKDISQYTYSSNSFSQNGKTAFSVNSNTTVLYVPADRTEKKKYAKKTVSSAFTSGDAYYVEAYDINSSKIAGLVILYGNDGTLTNIKKDTDFSIVASLPETVYNEEKDETVEKFDVFAGASNTVKSWTTYDAKEFSNVQVGDVIQFAYDSDNLIQGRVNNISFSDIASVLDGQTNNDQKFNWREELTPSESNNYQKYKFDYRFKRAGTENDEIYTSSTMGTVPYSRACMYNVSQVLLEDNKLYVTQDGFYENEDGILQLDDDDYEEITITSSTKILRMEEDREEISRYAADTTTDLTINDIKDAKNYGADCSKILVCSSKGVAKLIVIYN